MRQKLCTGVALCALGISALAAPSFADDAWRGGGFNFRKHVLIISIDGMHAIDFANCAKGLATVNGGAPYCANMAALAETGYTYTEASTSRPSDSFPGTTAILTGGSPRTTGGFYDVSYDRALSPPAATTPYGITGAPNLCPGTVGTQIGFDEEIDADLTKLNAGGSIDTSYLPRDPKAGCAPVYPHTWVKVNSLFEVVRDAGGYTAWSDKHLTYTDIAKGMSGQGLNDEYSPEINSIPINLTSAALTSLGQPQLRFGPSCATLPDQTAVASSNAWTDSFANMQCYDSLKVTGILNQIDGLDHTGRAHTQVPNVFGMNFQAVSVGEKLVEKSLSPKVTGGYVDSLGTPSAALLSEIKFVDSGIGAMVAELKGKGLYDSTTIIITAKHGQSPIDPARVMRITGDTASNPNANSPATILGFGVTANTNVVQASEDDISLIWLANRSAASVASAVGALEQNAANAGFNAGEIYTGAEIGLWFDTTDSRSPDILITPNVGVIYTGGTKKVAEHGGFAHDDVNVMMLVSNPELPKRTYYAPVQTAQVAPTALRILGLDPEALDAVRAEGVKTLPGF